MKKVFHICANILEALTILCFIVLAGITFLNIGGSWAGSTTLGWTEEIISCFTTWMVYLGYAYLCERDEHVAVTILHDSVPEGVKKIMWIIIRIANICAGVALVYGGWTWVQSNANKITSVLQFPYKYMYSAIYVSSILFTIFAAEKLVEQILGLKGKPGEAEEK